MTIAEQIETPPVPLGVRAKLDRMRRAHDDGRQWFAFRTKPQREVAARDKIAREGIVAMVPMEVRWRRPLSRYKRGRVPVSHPVLIGYVFAGFEGRPDWSIASRIDDITAVVGFAGQPARIPASGVAALLRLHGDHTPAPSVSSLRSIRVGGVAEVVSGPFSGRQIKVEEINDQKVLTVLHLFGAQHRVAIRMDDLEAA